ncbi:MAG: hypothetical protein JW818_20295 [Pirellulales bacterium]|nr:hypothetical protein [Pirellulales bacterium]
MKVTHKSLWGFLTTALLVLALAPAARASSSSWDQRILRDANAGPTARVARRVTSPLLTETDDTYASMRLDPKPLNESSEIIDPPTPLYEEDELGCGSVATCNEPGCGEYLGCDRHLRGRLLRRFTFFAGVEGFKGPIDQGVNGNFGFHEGFDFGGPLGGPWGLGYQAGLRAVQSDLSGNQVVRASREGRDQLFFTGSIFHRARCGGWQWAAAYDLLHDRFYDTIDLGQVRAEISWAQPGYREIGFWGSFGTKDDAVTGTTYKVTDLYTFFYRKHFSSGSEGRLWTGFTGNHDTLVGADFRVPLSDSWALENRFNYLIPKEGHGVNGQPQESWAVSLQLVWYPGRSAHCLSQDPFRPILGVADNAYFMVDRVH